MTTRIRLITCLLVAGVSSGAWSTESVDILRFVGSWSYGPSLEVAASGNRVFFSSGAMLRIAEVGHPEDPQILGELDLRDQINGLWTNGELVYAAVDDLGLRIVDVTNSSAPLEIGALSLRPQARDVEVVGTTAYVVTEDGLQIVDVAVPSAPRKLGSETWYPGDPWGIDVEGAFAYVADLRNGIQVLDVWNTGAPRLWATYEMPDSAPRDIEVRASHGYVVGSRVGLRILDLRYSNQIREIGRHDEPADGSDVVLVDDWAYVAARDEGIWRFYVGDPADPRLHIKGGSHGRELKLAVLPGLEVLVSANQFGGVSFHDIGANGYLWRESFIDSPGFVLGIAAQDDHVYLTEYQEGFRVVDTGSSPPFHEIGFVELDVWFDDLEVDENTAIVRSGRRQLDFIDVTSASQPVHIGSLDLSGYTEDLTAQDSIAYLAEADRGVLIVDYSDPGNAHEVAVMETPGEASEVAVKNGILFVADDLEGLRVVDARTHDAPVEIGHVETGNWTKSVFVSGSRAYVKDVIEGLWILDVDQPESPTVVGRRPEFPLNGPIASAGRCLFIVGYGSNLVAVDVGRPASAQSVESVWVPCKPNGLWVDGDRLYVGLGTTGFRVYDVSACLGILPPLRSGGRHVPTVP